MNMSLSDPSQQINVKNPKTRTSDLELFRIVTILCTIIDILRIRFVEKPLFSFWDKHWQVCSEKLKNVEKRICGMLKIYQGE